MKYSRIVQYVASTPWAIAPEKLTELLSVLAFRAAGHEFTRDEIQARISIGDDGAPIPQTRPAASVAVVPIRGVIAHRMGSMDESSGGTSAERIGAMLHQVAADPNIGTIVLDVDSPGGTVPGITELANDLFSIRKRGTQRIIAVANDLMASAAYWIASQADEIVSIPSGLLGSIGVFAVHEDLSVMLKQECVAITLLSAGKYKTEGNAFEPLSDEARAFMQARVDEAYGQFVTDVARGRGVTAAAVKGGYGEGRALSPKEAKAAGLIDRIATWDETLSRVIGQKSSSSLRAEDDQARRLLL